MEEKIMDKDKIDKKDHILDVAERVFSDMGFDGASTRTISGEAGVNMAMLNYYFGSKEGLFLAIFDRKITSMRTFLQNIANDESRNAWEKMNDFAGQAGLNREVFKACLASPEATASVDASVANGKELEVQSTPTIFVNGRRIVGADPHLLEQYIKYELAHQKADVSTK